VRRHVDLYQQPATVSGTGGCGDHCSCSEVYIRGATLLRSKVFGRWRSTFSRGEWNFVRNESVRRETETLPRERVGLSQPRYGLVVL